MTEMHHIQFRLDISTHGRWI